MGFRRKEAQTVDHAFMEKLRKVDLFKDLSEDHLVVVAELVEERVIRADEEITREGAFDGDFYVVFSGDADISVRGKQRATVGPGEFFGEVAMLRRARSATVTARTEMELGVIDAQQLHELLDSEPRIAVHLVDALIARLEDLTTRPAGRLL